MKIVDIIPQSLSGESRQDVGASIAVNPNNPNEIVIAAWTRDPANGPNAPVFVSTDGGTTWSLKNIVPGNGPTGTNGITVTFGQSGNELYAGVINGDNAAQSAILRTSNPAGGALMTQLDSGGLVEQPSVAVATVPAGPDAGKDRLYVGWNDLYPATPLGPGLTSTIRQTMDAASAAPVFNSILLDRRPKTPGALQDLTPPRNGPQVRPAVHPDGTVYAVFYSWKTWADSGAMVAFVNSDVVIVRDDKWGQSADPYGSLVDSGDGQPGQRIATDVSLEINGTVGAEQIAGDLAIAVDPTNSSIVYVAWTEWQDDGGGGEVDIYWLHLRRSTDRGQTWSAAGMAALPNAKSPALAINDKGQVGFLYRILTGTGTPQTWETHLAFTEDAIHWSDTVLATMPAIDPIPFFPFIGGYNDLMTVGDTFYGVFCNWNDPNLATFSQEFPLGAKYQRNHSGVILYDVDQHTPVAPSIDPFFFQTTFIAPSVMQQPKQNTVAEILLILFGIIAGGGGAYIDGQGHVHIIGPGDPGPVWEYLVSLAQYRLATATDTRAGLEMQKLALQNVAAMANAKISQINGQLGAVGG